MIDVEMFLKLKHQHGDVLVTKTLMFGHLKMATKVQKSLPSVMIDVEMFLKLKHQHGDVLVTKTLMLRHLKMATKVQKSLPLAVINSPPA
jgi:hypothetical protein